MIKIFKLLTLFSLCFLCFGCRTQDHIHTITVGVSPDYPPFALKSNDVILGFEIDVMEAIAKKINKKIVWKDLDFNALIPSVITGKIDAALSGIVKTQERARKVDFTHAYYIASNCLVFHKERHSFTKLSDFQEKIIGVNMGTGHELLAKEIIKIHPFTVRVYTNTFQIIEEVKHGRVDAAFIGLPQGIEFCAKNEQLDTYTLPREYSEGGYAIALPKNSQLLNEINNAIATLKNEGEFEALKKTWLKENSTYE